MSRDVRAPRRPGRPDRYPWPGSVGAGWIESLVAATPEVAQATIGRLRAATERRGLRYAERYSVVGIRGPSGALVACSVVRVA